MCKKAQSSQVYVSKFSYIFMCVVSSQPDLTGWSCLLRFCRHRCRCVVVVVAFFPSFFFSSSLNRFVSSSTSFLFFVRKVFASICLKMNYLCTCRSLHFLLHLFYNGINNITKDAEDSLQFVCTLSLVCLNKYNR